MAIIKVSIRNIFFPIVFTIVLFIIFANSSYLSGEVKTKSLSCLVNQDLSSCKGNTCPTIQECINHNENQLAIDIKILDKVYTKCEKIYLDKSLILSIQSDDKQTTTIQCEGEDNEEFSIHSLSSTDSLTISLENLIFDGQNGINNGIIVTSKHKLKNTLTLSNVKIMGCNSNNNGGGLSAMNFEVLVKNSSFENNWAKNGTGSGNGGAIWTNHLLTVQQSTFKNNRADQNGGSINSPNLIVVDSQFENGNALNGGAISADIISVQNTDFINNRAIETGGALEITSANVSSYIYKSRFNENSAAHGGHIFLLPLSINILKSEFIKGQAEFGGAIYVQDKHYDNKDHIYDFMDSVFDQNKATMKGGAFYSIHLKTIRGGLFKNSQSKDSGIQSFPDYYLQYLNTAFVSNWSNCSNSPAIFDKDFDNYLCLGVSNDFCDSNNLSAKCNQPLSKNLLSLNNFQNNKFLN